MRLEEVQRQADPTPKADHARLLGECKEQLEAWKTTANKLEAEMKNTRSQWSPRWKGMGLN
jgi:hypothetical protein